MSNIFGEIVMHFDDELGILSIIGAGIAGAGLASVLSGDPSGVLSLEYVSLFVGVVLLILDYFM